MVLLRYSLLLVPVPLLLDRWDFDPPVVFAAAVLGLVPLAGWVSVVTEDLARRVGALGGSLLNAGFSNAAELIIAVFALRSGLTGLVKASLVGAVVANILLVMGASFLVGGLLHRGQKFQRRLARHYAGMLTLAVLALLVPTVFHHTRPGLQGEEVHQVSRAVALILLLLYGLFLLYSLRTYERPARPPGRPGAGFRRSAAACCLILAGAIGTIAWLSNILVARAEPVMDRVGISQLALGFIAVPLAGNAAEYVTAIAMGAKNRMNLAVGVAASSSIQVVLLLAPLLVLLSPLVSPARLSLVFTLLEVTALVAAVAVANFTVAAGRSSWFEGVQLIAAYLILAFAVLFV